MYLLDKKLLIIPFFFFWILITFTIMSTNILDQQFLTGSYFVISPLLSELLKSIKSSTNQRRGFELTVILNSILSKKSIPRTSIDPNYMKRIITGDETWVLWVPQANKVTVFGVALRKRAETEKTAYQTLENQDHADSIFDYCGIVHSKFLTQQQTLNKEHFLGIIRH